MEDWIEEASKDIADELCDHILSEIKRNIERIESARKDLKKADNEITKLINKLYRRVGYERLKGYGLEDRIEF